MLLGGKGSGYPVAAQTLNEALEPDQIIDAVKHVIGVYQREGKDKERLCKTIERVGIAMFRLP